MVITLPEFYKLGMFFWVFKETYQWTFHRFRLIQSAFLLYTILLAVCFNILQSAPNFSKQFLPFGSFN